MDLSGWFERFELFEQIERFYAFLAEAYPPTRRVLEKRKLPGISRKQWLRQIESSSGERMGMTLSISCNEPLHR